MSSVGKKSDRFDCEVICILLGSLHQQLESLRPDPPEIIFLRVACQDRVALVEEQSALTNELHALLKGYYPGIRSLLKGLDRKVAVEFLRNFPS